MGLEREIKSYRILNDISQEELAQQLNVPTEDLISWEKGEKMPNDDELKILSKKFNVSVNTLLGSPKQLICQCCGMPLDDAAISKEPDGTFNEEYCQWCYNDGKFTYDDMETLIDFCVNQFASEQFPADQIRASMEERLPKLNYWKNR